jgi:hypothetical protein
MTKTVGEATQNAHANLGKATHMLAETVQELDDVLGHLHSNRPARK